MTMRQGVTRWRGYMCGDRDRKDRTGHEQAGLGRHLWRWRHADCWCWLCWRDDMVDAMLPCGAWLGPVLPQQHGHSPLLLPTSFLTPVPRLLLSLLPPCRLAGCMPATIVCILFCAPLHDMHMARCACTYHSSLLSPYSYLTLPHPPALCNLSPCVACV